MMVPSLPGLAGSGQALRIVGPGYADRLQHLRDGAALVQGPSGMFADAAANTPRFQGGPNRLLVEDARTNLVRNPRGEGASIGSGITRLPAYWQIDGTVPTIHVIGTGTEDGLPFVELRFVGSSTFALRFEGGSMPLVTSGQTYVSSFFLRLTGGSLSNLLLQNNLIAGGNVQSSLALMPLNAPLGQQRSAHAWTYSGGAAALASRLRAQSSGSFDITLRLAAPQLEAGFSATSPILPAAEARIAALRTADRPVWAPALPWAPSGTLILHAMLPQPAPPNAEQGLLQLDDGGDQNRLVLANAAGGNTIQARLVGSGTDLGMVAGGTVAPGTAFRAALAWSPDGMALCLDGGIVRSVAGGPSSSLTRLLVGHASAALNRAANGEIAALDYSAARLPDASLQALTAAG
ncbi:phage head spike fiber domain-containing protein [Teichococcus oryzae]|uniref:Uncharacterized protein n=1 Tax=Teichococcus oryzae TaxID=1608942 RepID=A0A5B2TJL7_9PROT|nr:hypothetical protein [Pseudoroseomonas oryzae]KAA2214682.1 hypothetical protein F0Q34_03000 [Pseudoroseomonas oryzae]